MNIRPIDVKILYPKSTEVSQVVLGEQQKENMLRHINSQKNQAKVDEDLRRVREKDNASEIRLSQKQEREKQEPKKSKKQQKGFDIRI
ncbi:hypothetical protein B0S90_2467 [Caldicellulosiruptor bescii]|jgi:hypothetical protein|uniref:Uncharacterized protein n=2 Tax=Caldicellulosiruptor bescii TaxID=31899 RepID=B9MLZ4_CALBD|nr:MULTISPECIES: hypothetical protein [Caldicellulosiruptor]ACM61217.1 conserved hypothetical protein [Caldicellulosiruptor bescii DSM 6725]PBC88970.1 hypothetical protein B0S87_2023 [Caldicellulosiruptor bescii]PBC91548.1 hypothetical protein B0S89_1969 [Caldicellulosiruptor bescii]PBD03039.1 hypothetical protein B0S85_0601 [Caldicellulosiruptor bescii]PBD07346.1 hypothetical protein B0S90_2467 [Caldicellulosiruptor bescii]